MGKITQDKVNITLDKDEAIVLFEFLARYNDTNKLEIDDQAEQVALWNLLSVLEGILTEPFQKDYDQLLKNARDSIRHDK